jgi:hypothetical protein
MKVSQVRVSINTVQVVQLVSQYGVYNITAHRVSEMRTTGMVYKHGIEEKYNSTTISPQGVSKAKKSTKAEATKRIREQKKKLRDLSHPLAYTIMQAAGHRPRYGTAASHEVTNIQPPHPHSANCGQPPQT